MPFLSDISTDKSGKHKRTGSQSPGAVGSFIDCGPEVIYFHYCEELIGWSLGWEPLSPHRSKLKTCALTSIVSAVMEKSFHRFDYTADVPFIAGTSNSYPLGLIFQLR